MGYFIITDKQWAMLRDTGMLPFTQIGHKCYYKREDVERLLQTKSEKTKNNK